ncbi:Retrovirus-related Pol polyprotein from transposon 17.6 [Vitis vinifera]|uniref:Retrovirus-related Pol polyprotein from transposon 17.6 n=1 Tax=Vitis vinifera TaxID=29760 RepID=A0A438FNG9_VITVI|nr:Retrovirus-related Pol polyprotein from transposon 17.6 [Vitis vinifera]
MLVDSTAGHSMLSFMDGFSGYSQILMAPEDMEKTSFITEWGTYCYRVMPFGLKNAGATYQRAATTLFHDMMHRDVEFRLRLNPKKCTFGVTSGKLLGYMVSERGIEVDPDKIRAILDMPAPRTEREVRGFLGRLQYISRFIARLTDIFWRRLHQAVLYSYTISSDVALGCMLAQLDDSGKDRAIYYLSKRMLDYETRYVMIERYCLALVWATRRLRHYMTEYSVHLISKSIRGSIVADHLASLPVSDARAIDDDFPDEDVAAVTSLSGWRISVRLAFSDRHPATNNIVEFRASGRLEMKLRPYHAYLELLVARFEDLRYTHLPRAQNQFADALATLASMIDIPADATVRPLLIESRSAPAYCCLIDDMEIDDGLPWYHDIYHFLRLGVYPEAATAKDRRALRQLATRFVICGETLYRRSPDGMLLLCLDRASADRVMREIVASSFRDVRVSDTWRSHSRAALELHALTSPWPFSVWGIDIIGKISEIFQCPSRADSDRGVHFRAEVDTLVQRYSIRHHRSTAYRPQTNGAVEAANKNIKRILRKMVETSRDWSRSSFRIVGISDFFSHLYRSHTLFIGVRHGGSATVEIEMGSLRVALEQQIPETDWAQARFDQLNLLDERRLRAADHVRAYQRKMARAFKKRVKPRPLHGVDSRGRCMADGFRWKPVLRADNVDQLKSLICFTCLLIDTMFTLGTISFPSFLSPYHPSLHYVPCLKTTLRPWDQISSSTASMWTDAILGHIPFRRIFMDFAEVTCSRIDDSMLSDLRPILHFDAIQGHISVRMRFTDHEGVACLSLFARFAGIDDLSSSDFSTCYISMPHWGIFPILIEIYRSPLVYMIIHGYEIHARSVHLMPYWGIFPSFSHGGDRSPHVRRSRLVEILLAISSSLRFAAACYTGAYFPHIVSLQSGVQSRRSFTVYDIQSHHVTFFSSVFRATSQFDVQSHHHHFLVSAFRAITTSQFRRSEPSSVFRSTFRVASRFGVQSRYHFSASVFRAIITTSLSFGVQSRHRFSDRRSESRSRFRRSESLSLLSFGVQSHHHYFSQFRRSESSSVFRSTFRVAFSVSAFRVVITSQLRCSEPSSLLLSVSAFRVVIGFQIDVQSRVLGFGVQSRYHFSVSVFRAIITTSLSFGVQSHHRFSDRHSESSSVSAFRVVITSQFDVQSHHHHFSVSAFRAIIGFQIDIQSRILGFGVQSHHHFSVSAFKAVIGFQINVQSRVLGFGVQSRYHFSASVFRAIITTSLSFGVQSRHRFSDRRSESRSRFRRSESLSLLSFGVQSHHHYFSQFRRSESSSVFRSTFRVAFSVSAFRVVITSQFRCSEPSSLLLSVSAFRVIIVFRSTFRVPSSVSAFRVVITSQFDVQSHHHHFSVSTFRAIIGFQIDIQSRILGFSVQSRYHFSV